MLIGPEGLMEMDVCVSSKGRGMWERPGGLSVTIRPGQGSAEREAMGLLNRLLSMSVCVCVSVCQRQRFVWLWFHTKSKLNQIKVSHTLFYSIACHMT